MKPLIYDLGLV